MNWISLISLPVAYLIGSISSAYIIARVNGKIDVRDEPDGKISAAAVYRRVGLLSFLGVVALDIGKAILAVLIAWWLNADLLVLLLAGIFAIAGHQWSIFLKFQGGLGATTIGGVLFAIVTLPMLVGAAIAAILAWRTKNSSYSFGIGVIMIAIVLFAMQWSTVVQPWNFISPPPFPPSPLLIVYPLLLLLMMVLKWLQVKYRPGAPLIVK